MKKNVSDFELEKKAKRIEAQNKAAKKSQTVKTIVICAVLVLAIVAGVVATVFGVKNYQDSGAFLRNKEVITSENYTVDAAMLSYAFYRYIDDMNLASIGASLSTSLKEQYFYNYITMFDYIMNYGVLYSIYDNMYFAEWGRDNNLEISEDAKADIEEAVAELKSAAVAKNMELDEYLSAFYGRGVNENDVRKMEEINAYGTQAYDYFVETHDYSDEEINKYFDEHSADFIYASYVAYSFSSDDAQARAEAAANCKTVDELKEYVKNFLIETGTKEADANTTVDAITETSIPKSTDDDIADFIFGEGVKVGDTKVISGSTGKYTVCLVTEAAQRKEYALRDVRHILFSLDNYKKDEDAKAKAEEILAEYKKGDLSEDAFAELAKQYSDDSSNKIGGLCEGVDKGQMVEEFENWVFDSSRVIGDVDIIKTSYGYHIMYYVGEGETAWKKSVSDTLLNADMEEMAAEITVDIDYDAMISVPGNARAK